MCRIHAKHELMTRLRKPQNMEQPLEQQNASHPCSSLAIVEQRFQVALT